MSAIFQKVAAFAVLVSFFGCLPPAKSPIETLRYDAASSRSPRFLLVYLPGNGDSVTVFQKRSLVEAVRKRGLPADIIAVNAHLGYYLNNNFLTRLKNDVIDPAKAKGYSRIWLVGNSLGGYGSLFYAREHPGDIAGVVALGPFLGNDEIIGEIRNAGGIQAWEPGTVRGKNENDWARDFWAWVKDRLLRDPDKAWGQDCGQRMECGAKIYLGYGRHDRFAPGQGLLAELMPADQVIAIEGGHNWFVWKKLWDLFLDRNIFPY